MTYSVGFKDGVLLRIKGLAAQSRDGLETGGLLLGHGPDLGDHIQVVEAGDPGPTAQREPAFFLRDLGHAQVLAERAWERENAIWVGEWHTHLTDNPTPSLADLSTYAGLLQSTGLEFEVFLSLIVTPHSDSGWQEPQIWPWVLTVTENAMGVPQAPQNQGNSL